MMKIFGEWMMTRKVGFYKYFKEMRQFAVFEDYSFINFPSPALND